jgi:4-amino-4-deoxy-L-arabinose transferase-like glycosyltransferase
MRSPQGYGRRAEWRRAEIKSNAELARVGGISETREPFYRLPLFVMSATPIRHSSAPWWRDLLILSLVSALWFCGLLGMRPLSNPDEGRYTEIPREMAVTGDYVTPRLNGVKYFEKPPLVYWLSAVTIRQFGVSEFVGRIWGALFAVLGVLLTYAAGRKLYGRAAGLWAAVVLATTLMYFILSQIILLDMAVAVTISGALFAYLLAQREPRGRRRFVLFMIFYGFMALATLSKGLIGIALPGAVIFLWLLLLNRWRSLWPFYPLAGTLLLLAIAAPWHILAARANSDFLQFYFVHEHWERFTTTVHGRAEPAWFFLPILVAGLFPWVFFTVRALRETLAGGWRRRGEHAEAWFLLIWIVFIVAFFSKSQSKLVPYILPVFPACAVMFGAYLATLNDRISGKFPRAALWGFCGFSAALAVAIVIVPAFLKEKLANQTELAGYLPTLQVTMAGSLLVGAAAVLWLGILRRKLRPALVAMALTAGGFLFAAVLGAGHFEKTSTKDFARILKPLLKAEDRVYSVGTYSQDLPVYLERLISVVEYEGELQFGIHAEPERTRERFLEKAAFAKQWAAPGGAFAVVRRSSYNDWFKSFAIEHELLSQNSDYLLIAKPLARP